MKWVTRERPKTDRIACPWLIRRFIDAEGEFIYGPKDQVLVVAEQVGGHSFDAPNGEYTHTTPVDDSERCTFETLIEAHRLGGDPALARLAKIVHAADISADVGSDPAGQGLLAIGIGGLDVEADDYRLLERATVVYDALYAWCERDVRQPST